ncbi:flagellar type III secretion system pore protein FliP [Legionella israelensis]|uniref:flagellar type III secretion system pore protein FliP n=1 Tax=Legionella israelensis TaxID=454 RepID=UPI00117EFFCC|nr:flagellar type III secretion system pore protein FliP [Legionella israelensis]QDP73453.1 flagellar type III secretion system pore protein FliP [Legionella israelensis]
MCRLFFIFLLCSVSIPLFADNPSIPLLTTTSSDTGGETYSISVKILLFMTLLTLLPALLMTMTSFTRIIIVFAILRQAIGIPNVPSNQILIGLAFIMTAYVMMPVFSAINEQSLQPYLSGKINEEKAISNAGEQLKTFMLRQTRKADMNMFLKLSKTATSNNQYPFYILLPSFITSELKTAFQIGFLIFLPFLIIDLVTASVLMSMGMMMLSPMIISLPFKILFFVMLNGWSLMITSLVNSFRV